MSRRLYKYDITIDGICGPDEHTIIYERYESCSEYVDYCFEDGSDLVVGNGAEEVAELYAKAVLNIDDDHITRTSVWTNDLPDKVKERWKLNK